MRTCLRTIAAAALATLVMGFPAGSGVVADPANGQGRYPVTGMVLKVDLPGRRFLVSHDSVLDVMPAMAMWFDLKDPQELRGVTPGAIVEFVLAVGPSSARAEHVKIRQYVNLEQDPLAARRLRLLKEASGGSSREASALSVGQAVPDFSLLDQARRAVTLSQLRGRVLAVNFIYTSCALPQFCFRMANHFGVLQKRFKASLGRDLMLLTITFDPARDQPERLAEYAKQWNADPHVWHFLTGPAPDLQRVCALFGVDAFPDEGLLTHTTRTAIIDRRGILRASIEGNEFTAGQLGDLVQAALNE
jgi:protein SCO1/2